ncbi:hypothetical protein CQA49_08085 [Helicobacter sp. MIT 00-7814]|nr:hypothetical protein CQA37_09235 [Helicobacter sp. MIT 99-10781]RDU52564.1 hypothetical protein CQA49_08085 [Helicobacter sp. MIT 00-7814]
MKKYLAFWKILRRFAFRFVDRLCVLSSRSKLHNLKIFSKNLGIFGKSHRRKSLEFLPIAQFSQTGDARNSRIVRKICAKVRKI